MLKKHQNFKKNFKNKNLYLIFNPSALSRFYLFQQSLKFLVIKKKKPAKNRTFLKNKKNNHFLALANNRPIRNNFLFYFILFAKLKTKFNTRDNSYQFFNKLKMQFFFIKNRLVFKKRLIGKIGKSYLFFSQYAASFKLKKKKNFQKNSHKILFKFKIFKKIKTHEPSLLRLRTAPIILQKFRDQNLFKKFSGALQPGPTVSNQDFVFFKFYTNCFLNFNASPAYNTLNSQNSDKNDPDGELDVSSLSSIKIFTKTKNNFRLSAVGFLLKTQFYNLIELCDSQIHQLKKKMFAFSIKNVIPNYVIKKYFKNKFIRFPVLFNIFSKLKLNDYLFSSQLAIVSARSKVIETAPSAPDLANANLVKFSRFPVINSKTLKSSKFQKFIISHKNSRMPAIRRVKFKPGYSIL